MLFIIWNSFWETGKPPKTTEEFFKFGRILGRGAFGRVHLAMHKVVRKCLAIKVLNKQFLNDEKAK